MLHLIEYLLRENRVGTSRSYRSSKKLRDVYFFLNLNGSFTWLSPKKIWIKNDVKNVKKSETSFLNNLLQNTETNNVKLNYALIKSVDLGLFV